MTKEIYKQKFISYMIGKSGCEEEHAQLEYDAIKADLDSDEDDPHYTADECMSYWEE